MTTIEIIFLVLGLSLVAYIFKNGVNTHTIAEYVFNIIESLFKGIWWFLQGLVLGFKFKSTAFGSAKFMSHREKNKFISMKHEGVIVECRKKIPLDASFQHVLISATTGSGKSTKYVLPNLLGVEKKRNSILPSFVVTDPTLELYESAGYLHSIGYDIKKLDFDRPDQSFGYNPLHNIQDQSEVESVADILVEAAYPDMSSDNVFWNDMSKQILTILCKCLLHSSIKSEYRNLYNVRHLLNSFGKDGKALNTFFAQTAGNEIDFQEIMSFLANEPKVLQSSLATAKSVLKIFSNQRVCKVMSNNTLNFETLRERPTALFVTVPENKQQLYKGLLSLFYQQLFDFLMELPQEGQTYLPVFGMLEEIGNMYLPNLSGYISVLRKRSVSLSLIIQAQSQLYDQYGQNSAKTILQNVNTKIYFPGLDVDTCERVQSALGKGTIMYAEPSESTWERSGKERLTARPLLTSDEIRTMDYPILIYGNKAPIVLKNMHPFYQVPELLKRARMPNPEIIYPSTSDVAYIDLEKIGMADGE